MNHNKKKFTPPKVFRKLGDDLAPYFSNVEIDLAQAKIKTPLNEHISMSIFASVNNALMIFAAFLVLGIFSKNSQFYLLGILLTPLFLFFTFYSTLYQPKVKAKIRAREIDRELPYALRHLLINVRSGIPVYNAFVSISEGYGAVSEEINGILKEVNGGKSEIEALEESIITNPSFLYRKAFWQILNALRTGTDVEVSLRSAVENIIKEQLISIKKYGQELNPFTMLYMMIGVIMPSLGITLLMLLSNFTGTGMGKSIFYLILAFLIVFQLVFMNIVKTKRPLVRL